MKLSGAVAVLAAGTGAWATDRTPTPGRAVTACMNPGANGSMIYRGQATAAQILKQAGVRLDWRGDERACADGAGIVVRLSLETPANQHPGALAYALPFDQTRIVVFYDRVVTAGGPMVLPKLLGHVLAHELVHMLQGVNVHSSSSMMKPRWDKRDYSDMQRSNLHFSQYDLNLIDRGVAWRASQVASAR